MRTDPSKRLRAVAFDANAGINALTPSGTSNPATAGGYNFTPYDFISTSAPGAGAEYTGPDMEGRRPLTDEEAEALLGTGEPYDFTGSPGYQFRYNEGLRALQNGLIGRGLGLSGRAVKEAERFGQNYAADEFNAEFARNATLAGLSPPSVGSMNALIGNFATNAGNLAMNQGQIGANSAYNNANIFTNALNNLSYGYGQYLNGGYGG